MDNIPELVEKLAEELGSYYELAERLGVSRQTVHGWRTGKAWPRKCHYEALMALLEVGK